MSINEESADDRAKLRHFGLDKEEVKKLLKDYLLIPRHRWLDIVPGSHVRYFHKKLGFRYGGYVVMFWPRDEPGAILIENIKNGRNTAGYKSYFIQLENIDNLFKKITECNFEIELLQGQIDELSQEIKGLKQAISKEYK